MNIILLAAAICAALICLIHVVLGGRAVARPLLAAEGLRGIPKYTAYFCWHIVTITLAGMALAFLLAALPDGARVLALFATGGAALFALLCLGINVTFGLGAWRHPQWALFLPVTALGAAGLWFWHV